jgi:hypothetical protein
MCWICEGRNRLSIPDAEFGWCVVVVTQPLAPSRFYGPFKSESDAKAWIDAQPFNFRTVAGLMPLRRTDKVREFTDFYAPWLDCHPDDFWVAEVADGDSDAK